MALTAVYQQELINTRNAVAQAVAFHWNQLPDYYDNQIDPFLAAVIPIVKAGQEKAVALTDAYMSQELDADPIGLNTESIVANIRQGVPPEEVYKRPFTSVWTSIGTIGLAKAVTKGLDRLTSTAEMDVAMSARDASLAYASTSRRVAGFVRVAHPGCCDFCQTVNGARVHSGTPSPLHPHCPCTVKPISYSSPLARGKFESFRPGTVMGDTKIEEHGELGPLLTNKFYAFTGPEDLNN